MNEQDKATKQYRVAILSKEFPPYHNRVVEGLYQAQQLYSQAFGEGKDLVSFSLRLTGDLDWGRTAKLVDEIIQEAPDAVIPVGALCTQVVVGVFAERSISIPIIFAGAANPDGIGITQAVREHNLAVTGTSLGPPPYLLAAKVLQLIKPTVKHILLPYSTLSDGGSLENAALLIQEYFSKHGITVLRRPFDALGNPVDLIQSWLGECDSVLLLEGCHLNDYYKPIVSLCRRLGITCFVSDADAVSAGAAAGLITDPHAVSRDVFEKLGAILMQGAPAAGIPFTFLRDRGRRLGVNLQACKEQGVFLDPVLVDLLGKSSVFGHIMPEGL